MTRLIDLTVGELRAIIGLEVEKMMRGMAGNASDTASATEEPAYGMEGIARSLGCSISTATRMKSEGLLEGGYVQFGRKITVQSPEKLRRIASRNIKMQRRNRTTKHNQ